jgi:hypothetical protein
MVAIGLAIRIEIVFRTHRRWRGFARVDHDVPAVTLTMQQEQSAAADTGALRLDDRQGRADRDRGVERVAAVGEHLEAGLRRERMRARDRRVRRFLAGSDRAGREQGRRRERNCRKQEKRQQGALRFHGVSPLNRWYLSSSASGDSGFSGSVMMHSTGHTTTHCGSAKWPTHSVHSDGAIS